MGSVNKVSKDFSDFKTKYTGKQARVEDGVRLLLRSSAVTSVWINEIRVGT